MCCFLLLTGRAARNGVERYETELWWDERFEASVAINYFIAVTSLADFCIVVAAIIDFVYNEGVFFWLMSSNDDDVSGGRDGGYCSFYGGYSDAALKFQHHHLV